MHYKLMTIAILAGLAVIFLIQNLTVVEVSFLFWSVQLSSAILMLLMLVIGLLLGWLLHGHLAFSRKKDD